MVRKTFKNVPYRRKREDKTDYRTRLKMLQSGRLRLVLRRSLKNFNIQVIQYKTEGDQVVAEANSKELEKLGWTHAKGNIPAAYLTGYLLGRKCQNKGLKDFIVDIGMQKSTRGSRLYAAVKGFTDSGIEVNCDEKMFPSDDRIKGEHISKDLDLEQIKEKIK